jgi:hypothetical protein
MGSVQYTSEEANKFMSIASGQEVSFDHIGSKGTVDGRMDSEYG